MLNRHRSASHIRIESELVSRLKRLVDETDASIVLSTFWRHFEEYITYILHRHGVGAHRIIGRTPGKSDASRLSASSADERHYAQRAEESSHPHPHPHPHQTADRHLTEEH